MNRQRGFLGIPLTFIMYGIGALVVIAAVGVAIYRVQHWCNSACKEQTQRADAAEASIKVAQERATAMTLLWDKERQQRETDARQRDTDRTIRFAPIQAAAHNLPAAVARVVFPAAASRLLDDAIRAGNANLAPIAADAPKEASAPAPIASGVVNVAGVTAWGVTCAQQYAEVADQVLGLQAFYESLRAAQ